MSRVVGAVGRLQITSHSAGTRGPMLQLTVLGEPVDYVQLDAAEAACLAGMVLGWLKDTAARMAERISSADAAPTGD